MYFVAGLRILGEEFLKSYFLNSILSSGFSNDYKQWFISKHHVSGSQFKYLWESNADEDINNQDLDI
jgi:hypothetical protein